MKRTGTLALALGALLLGSSANAAPLVGYTLVAQTAHLAFYALGHKAPDSKRIEGTLVRLAGELGAPDVAPGEFYFYESRGELSVITGQNVSGITYPALHQVHTTKLSTDHELVHLVAAQLGDPGVFFQEGLAVALGDHGKYLGRDVDGVARPRVRGVDIDTLIARFSVEDTGEGYAVAGSFVKYLIRQFGLDRVSLFFRSCRGHTPEDAFASTFGQSMQGVGATWAAQV